MKYLIIILLLTTSLYSQSRYELTSNYDVIDWSYAYLISQVGLQEKTGNNDGKHVQAYLLSIGIKTPASYCMAGQYWCFWMTGMEVPVLRTGVASKCFSDAKKRGKKTAYKPKKHDLIFWKKFGSWQGHVERVIEVNKYGWVKTVGFNTSNGKSGSQREGNGNFIRKRNIKYKIGSLNILGLVGFRRN